MADDRHADGLRDRLRDALRVAMKQRDKTAIAAARAALSAIDNAEAADLSDAPGVQHGLVAGGVAGLGAGEVARLQVTDRELVEMLQDEIVRWESTAHECERIGRADDAARLREEIAVLRHFLTEN
jgi:uncharacterized protein YqeY